MNKREYKKAIESIGSALCVEMFEIGAVTVKADPAKIETAMNMVWNAMVTAKHGANTWFAQKERDFENRQAYRKAKAAYNKALFTKLSADFDGVIDEALKIVNEAMPQKD